MNFEVLMKSHLKRNILIGAAVIFVISACILTFSLAKYRTTKSIQIAKGTIDYARYDFKVMAMYQEGETGYTETEEMPGDNYVINEEKSYCTIDNKNKDPNAKLYTLSTGEHVMQGLKKNSKCYLYFDERICKIGDTVCNTIMANITTIDQRTDFSETVTEETTGKIYKAYDNDGPTYYFAGNPTDNWVEFAGYYWRIIRINGDGSIRLIYSGDSESGPVTTGTSTSIGSSLFNENNNDNAYVGYMYGSPGSITYEETHANQHDSRIKTVVDEWYQNNLLSYDEYISKESGFCGDRSIHAEDTGYGTKVTTYRAYRRIIRDKNPTFKCNDNDLYTVKNTNQGNQALTYPIGLLAVDEAMYAGGDYNQNNLNYYLYTNITYATMSPADFNYNRSGIFYIDNKGWINGDFGYSGKNQNFNIRPVINLHADITLSGSGTSSDPYKLTA